MCILYNKNIAKLICILSIFTAGCGETELNTFQGYVEGEFSYISAETSGRISQIYVERGQSVSIGEKLLTLDDEKEKNQLDISNKDFLRESSTLANIKKGARKEEQNITQAKIAKARNDLQLAKSKLNKFSQLQKLGHVSMFELEQVTNEEKQQQEILHELYAELENQKLPAREDEIQAQQAKVDSAWLQVKRSTIELERRTLYSPTSGQIFDLIYKKGEMATVGSTLISLLPDDALKIRFFVPEAVLTHIKIGDKVALRPQNGQKDLIANISFISPSAEYTPPVLFNSKQSKMVFLIEARFDKLQSDLKPGQSVEVSLK